MYCNTLYNESDYTIPMQQLEIAHEKLITTDQKVVENTKTTRKKTKDLEKAGLWPYPGGYTDFKILTSIT